MDFFGSNTIIDLIHIYLIAMSIITILKSPSLNKNYFKIIHKIFYVYIKTKYSFFFFLSLILEWYPSIKI